MYVGEDQVKVEDIKETTPIFSLPMPHLPSAGIHLLGLAVWWWRLPACTTPFTTTTATCCFFATVFSLTANWFRMARPTERERERYALFDLGMYSVPCYILWTFPFSNIVQYIFIVVFLTYSFLLTSSYIPCLLFFNLASMLIGVVCCLLYSSLCVL